MGRWGAIACLQGHAGTEAETVISTVKLRVPQFHKMHDHATTAIKQRYRTLQNQQRVHMFDYSMERIDMEDANVMLLQVSANPGDAMCSVLNSGAYDVMPVLAYFEYLVQYHYVSVQLKCRC